MQNLALNWIVLIGKKKDYAKIKTSVWSNKTNISIEIARKWKV